MFDQCFANVWPKAWLSPQTVSNGAVCFAKCKHNTLNALILSNLLAFQRGRILISQHAEYKGARQQEQRHLTPFFVPFYRLLQRNKMV